MAKGRAARQRQMDAHVLALTVAALRANDISRAAMAASRDAIFAAERAGATDATWAEARSALDAEQPPPR